MSLGEAVAWTWIGLALAGPVAGLVFLVVAAYMPKDQRLKMPPPSTRKPRGYDGIGRWNP